MKKTAIVIFGLAAFSSAYAHDFWVDGYNSSTFKAHIGYGHDFPHPEPIAKERVSIFESIVLTDNNANKTTLKQKGENYQFIGKNSLDDGSYILSGTYKPTFWTKTKNNKWKMNKTKADLKDDAAYCELASMYAKSIINIGDAKDEFITKPIGQKLEIVPLENPANFKVGKPFTVQVLFNQKRLKTTEVKGTFAGYDNHTYPFYGKTDLEGKITITPLQGGKWILKTEVNTPFKDSKKCDEHVDLATLTFSIQ